MKRAYFCTFLIPFALAGCSDHQDHISRPQMSMKTTDARIVSLQQRSSDCNIESVDDTVFEPSVPSVSVSERVNIAGWLIDSKHKTVPGDAFIRVENEAGNKAWEQPVTAWNDRGDIVSTFGNVAAYQKSGFSVALDLGILVPGAYNIYVVFGPAGDQVACGVGRRFIAK